MKQARLGPGLVLALVMVSFTCHDQARAFCMEISGVNCVGQGHSKVSEFIEPILRARIYDRIWRGNFLQDEPYAGNDPSGPRLLNEIHFDSCRFATDGGIRGGTEYIRTKYRDAIEELDPSDPQVFEAAFDFGQLLHPAQDFYAHSNWINLLGLTDPFLVDPFEHLIDRGTGDWRELAPLSNIRGDIIVGQIPATGLPSGWAVTQDLSSEIPFFSTEAGDTYRGLITGYNRDGACPDVREGEIVDEWSHFTPVDPTNPVPIPIARTTRMVHGESLVVGPGFFGRQDRRPCHDGYPTYVCLQKDHKGRPDYKQAARLAEFQTAQEWCRFLHLTKDSRFGYSAASILMTLFANPAEAGGPHPSSTSCGPPAGVLTATL